MSDAERCLECGGRCDRMPLRGCDVAYHAEEPSLSWLICQDIEADLCDRRGFDLSEIDADILDALRDRWHEMVSRRIHSAASGLR